MSIMRISSLQFGLLPGGGVWLLPGSIANISSSSSPLVGFIINVGLEDIFLELLLLSRNSYKLQLQSVSLRQLQYWEDYKAQSIYKTIHLPQYSPPAASTKVISIRRYNPIRR